MIDSIRTQTFHQVATVRKRERVSLVTAGKRLGITKSQAGRLEDETVDLPISFLYRWAEILNVPITELLVPERSTENKYIWDRAKLVRVMRLVETLRQSCRDPNFKPQLTYLRNQLIEIMPELENIAPWPKHEHHRRLDDFGAITDFPVSDPFQYEEH